MCKALKLSVSVLYAVYPMISRRRFQQLEVLEGQNILVTISGKKNKIRVYYLSWLKTKILKTDVVSLWVLLSLKFIMYYVTDCACEYISATATDCFAQKAVLINFRWNG